MKIHQTTLHQYERISACLSKYPHIIRTGCTHSIVILIWMMPVIEERAVRTIICPTNVESTLRTIYWSPKLPDISRPGCNSASWIKKAKTKREFG